MPRSNHLRLVRNLSWMRPAAAPLAPIMSAGSAMASTKQAINLLRGWPSTDLLPAELIHAAATQVLADKSIVLPGLLYGPDEGYQPCREAIAAWLTDFYRPAQPIDFERIVITGGASQNMNVALGVYTDPAYTRNVWIVTPGYMLIYRMFEDAGFGQKLRAVPEDQEGIDIEYLRREIKKSEDEAQSAGNTAPRFKSDRQRAKVYKHVIYVVPSFSNPSSRTMTLNRRRDLVRLAREFDALIACDDVYDVLQWPVVGDLESRLTSARLPRIVDVDKELDGGAERKGADGFGNAMSNGTWSKLAGPGLRCGWAEGTAKFAYDLAQAGCQRSGGAPSHLTSTYLTHLLQTGQMQEHIREVLLPGYAARYRTLMAAVRRHLQPLGFTIPQPDREVAGGYFLWLGLPQGVVATELATRLQQEEYLIVAPGKIFEVPGDEAAVPCNSSIRLCFAWEDEAKLSIGVERIAAMTKVLLTTKDDIGEFVVVEKDTADMLQTFR